MISVPLLPSPIISSSLSKGPGDDKPPRGSNLRPPRAPTGPEKKPVLNSDHFESRSQMSQKESDYLEAFPGANKNDTFELRINTDENNQDCDNLNIAEMKSAVSLDCHVDEQQPDGIRDPPDHPPRAAPGVGPQPGGGQDQNSGWTTSSTFVSVINSSIDNSFNMKTNEILLTTTLMIKPSDDLILEQNDLGHNLASKTENNNTGVNSPPSKNDVQTKPQETQDTFAAGDVDLINEAKVQL